MKMTWEKWEICGVRQSGTYRGWRGSAVGRQVEIGQMQENYFAGVSLSVFSGCAVLTMYLHQSWPERLELRISLPISQDSQLTNALGYCKGRSPVTITKNWIWSIARQYLLEQRCQWRIYMKRQKTPRIPLPGINDYLYQVFFKAIFPVDALSFVAWQKRVQGES